MQRAELMVALRRDSAEIERDLVEQRVEAAYERVYEYLGPAADYLREILEEIGSHEGLRALRMCEDAFHTALMHAARSGIGCSARPLLDLSDAPRRRIPMAAEAAPTAPPPPAPNPDQLLRVGFRGE